MSRSQRVIVHLLAEVRAAEVGGQRGVEFGGWGAELLAGALAGELNGCSWSTPDKFVVQQCEICPNARYA